MIEEAAMKEIAPKDDEKIDQERLDSVRERIRGEIREMVGQDFDFTKVKPGSEEALRILDLMKKKGVSTIYPTVGLKELGELFSKASVGLSVGHGAQAGYNGAAHAWTNPEPEVVLFASSKGKIVGAAQGNDVNDRRTEGDSSLYLHEAKVRNGKEANDKGLLLQKFDSINMANTGDILKDFDDFFDGIDLVASVCNENEVPITDHAKLLLFKKGVIKDLDHIKSMIILLNTIIE
jgi:fumarylacetoacetate (FAA) hydrolase family protein